MQGRHLNKYNRTLAEIKLAVLKLLLHLSVWWMVFYDTAAWLLFSVPLEMANNKINKTCRWSFSMTSCPSAKHIAVVI